MEFTFQTAQLRDVCEKRMVAVAEIGDEAARSLAMKLADIDACDNAAEFRELCGDDLEEISDLRWVVHLAGGCRVNLVSGHVKPRRTRTGAEDWQKVTRLRIEAIGEDR